MTRRRRRRRRLVRGASILLGAVIVGLVAGAAFLASLPAVGNAPARVSTILAAHGGTPSGGPAAGKLGRAVVAVEDRRFYSNIFLNIAEGAARASLATLRMTGDPGGSTIAQQLAKVSFASASGRPPPTLTQIGLAVKLDMAYSKPTILEMYLNAIYYGHGYWGDVAASRGYFGVPPDRLDWAEAALLAGLPQAPSAYDPLRHLDLAKARQRHVLQALVSTGALSPAQANAAYSERLPLR
jgi:membrane peptidoglycan carboxypeptidase